MRNTDTENDTEIQGVKQVAGMGKDWLGIYSNA